MTSSARALLLLVLVLNACPEWLEVDDPDATEPSESLNIPVTRPVVLPTTPAAGAGRGPIVPATPGLRVPDAGYWTRVRLDIADIVLPYTWLSFAHSEREVTLRLEAVRRGVSEGGPSVPSLRATIPILLPRGTDAGTLAGLTLGDEALSNATVAMRTSWDNTWLVKLTRLSIEHVDAHVVKGSLEGVARRGSRGRTSRHFEAGFVALRAPEVGRR